MVRRMKLSCLGFAAVAAALGLQGCGRAGETPSPAPSPSSGGWKSHPVKVQGQHLYDSVTGAPFYARGIAFPLLGEDVSEYVKTLQRITGLSKDINMVRLYGYPKCALISDCFLPFMRKADSLGIYVLVAGTGVSSGYLPVKDCGGTADSCYRMGKVLEYGKSVIKHFSYPNTLAIVVGNELNCAPTFSVLKAYARDLKSHMAMCDSNSASPSKGRMRRIPLIYASSDDAGDPRDQEKADYLFCGNSSVSVDIFGLNIERWCDAKTHTAYDSLNKWVGEKKYPGAFLLTEMGCKKAAFPDGSRDWAQVRGFFSNFRALSGFSAYAYWNEGAPDWNMFDSGSSTANEYQDGKNFFSAVDNYGEVPAGSEAEPVVPVCAATLCDSPIQAIPGNYGTEDPSQCPTPPDAVEYV